jgi:hypothetical protein
MLRTHATTSPDTTLTRTYIFTVLDECRARDLGSQLLGCGMVVDLKKLTAVPDGYWALVSAGCVTAGYYWVTTPTSLISHSLGFLKNLISHSLGF